MVAIVTASAVERDSKALTTSMIQVNGKHELPWREGMTVSDVLELMAYTYHRIIVRVDGELVSKGAYDTYTVPEGADVKVIHMIGGG